MPGLDPASTSFVASGDVDGRVKPGHDEEDGREKRHEHPERQPLSRGLCPLAQRSPRASGRRRRARSTGSSRRQKVFDPAIGAYGRWFTRRRRQHLLQRARSPRRRRPRRSGRADPRFPARQHDHEIHLCRAAEGSSDARRRDAGFRRRQGRPRHPLHADGAGSRGRDAGLRADRRGALGGVRRLRRQGTGDPHRGRPAEADLLGKLRARARPHRALQAAARRGDPAVQRQARDLHHPAAAAAWLRSRCRPRSRLGDVAPRRARRRQGRALRAGARDRSALYPLHLGHHRNPEGRGARQWRAPGRAEMVDVQSLRRQARRGLVVRLRHRLGGRPQLHRLWAADPWRDHDHV